jgi:2-dehydropantoate 2-reductase
MRIAVIGSGAMGSLFGGLLTEAGQEVVLYDVRKDHVEAMTREGLRIDRPAGTTRIVDVEATTSPEDLRAPTLAVVFTKVTDTASALRTVAPHLGEADVLTVQNGFGNAEVVAEFVPEARVMAGVTEASADFEAPGHITHTGTGTTTFGRRFVPNDRAVEAVGAAFTEAAIQTEVLEDPRAAVWRKALVVLAFSPISALSRRPVDGIWDEDRDLVEAVIEEAVRVAEADGIDVGEDPIGHVGRVAEESGAHHPSMLQDVEAGRPTEIEFLSGEVVKRAADHGIAVPVNETLRDLVRLLENADR